MTQDDFQEWLENPVTEVFMKYLLDSAKEESEIVADSILSGSVMSESEQVKIASICVTLQRIAEITREEIEEFYHDRSTRKQSNHQT